MFDVLVVADESGFPFLETLDATLTSAYRALDCQREVHLVLPNPDLVYPKADGAFGLAAGSIAEMFEAAFRARYPHRMDLHFERLGKPHPALFAEALRRSQTHRMVMIGDQLETDIKGAKAFGLDTAWLSTGVTADLLLVDPQLRPTYRLTSLEPVRC
jgi:ribonucleotide monophosphatase NagD (HAD superfamily)